LRKAKIMMRLRTLISIGCLLAWAGAAVAQDPAPVAPAPAPFGISNDLMSAMALQASAVRSQAALQHDMVLRDRLQQQMVKLEVQLQSGGLSSQAAQAVKDELSRVQNELRLVQEGLAARMSADAFYTRGQSALDQRRWDEALTDFTQAASKGGVRADGALYWKAYALHKLGRRDEALAAIAELRKSYSGSRWLDDAKALELEVKQANGQPVSPESQTDEDLKLMALNGLMDSDPERAIPAVENLLKGAQAPRLKERALYVLAQSNSPKARQIVEQVARGGAGNPDLQVKAIAYLGAAGPLGARVAASAGLTIGLGADGQAQPQNGQLLYEIYTSNNDVNVKRAVLNSLSANRDSERLLQIAKTEKTPELRVDAVRRLASLRLSNSDALMAIYNADQDKNVKRAIVDGFSSQSNVKAMVAAARAERDPEMVRYIVGRLASMKSPEAADYLMEILKK
jgi:tetratricopeptide (TPR) repeat protein